MSSFFMQADEIDQKVQSGEIAGFAAWELAGEAILESVKEEIKNGTNYLSFRLKGAKGPRDFLVKIPGAADKDTAKYMGTQKLYACIHSVIGATPGKISISAAWSKLKEALDEGPINVEYKLSEYESFSASTGKMYTNQSLEALALSVGESGEVESDAEFF